MRRDVEYFAVLYAAAKDFTMKAYYMNILRQLGLFSAAVPERVLQKIYDRMV